MKNLQTLAFSFYFVFIPLFCAGAESAVNADIERIDSYVNADPDSAIILCDAALGKLSANMTPERVSLLSIRGNAWFTLGDYPAAIADFGHAVRLAFKSLVILVHVSGSCVGVDGSPVYIKHVVNC